MLNNVEQWKGNVEKFASDGKEQSRKNRTFTALGFTVMILYGKEYCNLMMGHNVAVDLRHYTREDEPRTRLFGVWPTP